MIFLCDFAPIAPAAETVGSGIFRPPEKNPDISGKSTLPNRILNF
jgi:hypothetical protein